MGKADGIPVYVPPPQDPSAHQAVLVTAFLTLAVFVALYVLVYVECLVRRWLWASALLIWACLVTLGYVLVYDSWRKAACVWEQVTGRGPGVPAGRVRPAAVPSLGSSPSADWACTGCAGCGSSPLPRLWFRDLRGVLGRSRPVCSRHL